MAFDNEELNRRRAQREQARKKRVAQANRLKIRLIAAAVILVVAGVLIWVVSSGAGGTLTQATAPAAAPLQTEAAVTTAPEETEVPPTTQPPTTTITIAAAGDLNINDAVVNSGGVTRDFTKVFMDVMPLLTDADLTLLNFEGNAVGMPYGTESASAPQELLDQLVRCGVDMVQVANSRIIKNGMTGMSSTLNALHYAGLETVGAYATVEDAKKAGGYTIKEIEGIKIAFVAFTKGMDSMALPEGSERCVNLLYKDYATTYQDVDSESINKVLKAAASERPDITIALLHWGSEYNDIPSDTQEEIIDIMYEGGVDAIIGTHPHYVQSIHFDEEAGTFLCYSLGDFISDTKRAGTEYSIVLNLEITRDNDTGATRITDYSYTPIFTIAEDDTLKVVRLKEAIQMYEEKNLDAVTESTYTKMTYAWQRVAERVTPETETEE